MDTNWDFSRWQPTGLYTDEASKSKRDADAGHSMARTKKEVESFRSKLINATKNIKRCPYAFGFWSERSSALWNLGFPELAAGDAYKALLLCAAALDYDQDDPQGLGETARLWNGLNYYIKKKPREDMGQEEFRAIIKARVHESRRQAYYLLAFAAKALCGHYDHIAVLQDAISSYNSDDLIHEMLNKAQEAVDKDIESFETKSFFEQKTYLNYGKIRMRVYPWEPKENYARSDTVMEAAKKEVKACSQVLELRRSPSWDPPAKTKLPANSHGLFATKRIRSGDTILRANNIYATCIEQGREVCYNCMRDWNDCDDLSTASFKCCGLNFCSSKCKQIAKKYYHDPLCGKDFDEIISAADCLYGGKEEGLDLDGFETELEMVLSWEGDHPARSYEELAHPAFRYPDHIPIYLARYISSTLLLSHSSPFVNPHIAQLQPAATGELDFTLHGLIKGPIKLLTTLGINVFENHAWDTWVILALWNRVQHHHVQNPAVDIPHHAMNPVSYWFNHSCAANAMVRAKCAPQVEVVAKRDIEKGEEVLVGYCGEGVWNGVSKVEDRAKELGRALGGVCRCERCVKETLAVPSNPIKGKRKGKGKKGVPERTKKA